MKNLNTNESDSRPSWAALRRVSVRAFIALCTATAILAVPVSAMAADSAEVVGREGGLGAAAALSSLVYAPAKLLYATGGLLVGGFAWAFTAGDSEVASKVFARSLKGTYVITPGMLTGDEVVEFIGREEAETRAPIGAVASAAPSVSVPSYEYTEQSYTVDGYPVDVSGTVTQGSVGYTHSAQPVQTYSEKQPTYDDLGW